MKKTEIFIAGNIVSIFSADITYKIEDNDNKKLYEDTMDTLKTYGFYGVAFNVDSTMRIHPYKDYATTYSILNNDDNSKYNELRFYWNGGYDKYFDYYENRLSNKYSYEELSKTEITVTNIKTANIEYHVDDKFKANETYKKDIDEINEKLFKNKNFGFIILRDHYNSFVNWIYPFLSVEYNEKDSKFIVKCDSEKFEKYTDEELYYTVTLKIPQDVIDDKKKNGYILQYKKEDLEKIKIEIHSKKGLTDNEIKGIINDNLDKRNIPFYNRVSLFDVNSKSVYTSDGSVVEKGNDYTFYSDSLFIKEAYKKKSDELKAKLDKITNISSNIPASKVVNITDIKERKILMNSLLKGMNDIIDSCVKYTADNVVNNDEYDNTVGKEFMTCDYFKEKIKISFDYLANLYIFLSSITDTEITIEKIKANDLNFDMSGKIFGTLYSNANSYFTDLTKKYKNKVEKLFEGKILWEKYKDELTEDLTKEKIFEKNKYNMDLSKIYDEKNKLINNAALDYYNTKYKTLQVKINNGNRIDQLSKYGLRVDNNYTYSLKVNPDLSLGVTFEFLKNNKSEFSNLCEECNYLFTIYDKNSNYIGYDFDSKIKEDVVNFNPAIEYYSSAFKDYQGSLITFNKMRENFKNREIKKINEFKGKAADFRNEYETVLKQIEYLTLSDKMYEIKDEPYYLKRFKEYLLGEKDIDGNDVERSKKIFCSFSDYNIFIINEINNAAIKKYNELQKAEMAEEDRKTVSELQTAVENSKNEIIGIINGADNLEKIKQYSTKENIKVELENTVRNKVADYDTKKAKFTTIDLFTNTVNEIEKVYKTKENAILEEIRKKEELTKQYHHKDEEEENKPTEEEKKKKEEEDKNSNNKEVQNIPNGTNSNNEQKPAKQKSKCCDCKK